MTKLKVKQEFINTISQLANEIELVFDYVPREKVEHLRAYVCKLKENEAYFDEQVSQTCKILQPHDILFYNLCIQDKKVKTNDLLPLNDLVLFDGILSFGVFQNENKNTKKSLVKYLNNLYMSGMLCSISNEEMSKELMSFLDTLNARTQTTSTSTTNTKHKHRRPQSKGIENIFDSLFSNPDIMNMATDISKDLQNQQVDPMELVSSLMSGKPNNQLNNLVSNITQKIEQKMASGEIDKSKLEDQAKNIMSKVQTHSDVIPMLKNILKNKNFSQLRKKK